MKKILSVILFSILSTSFFATSKPVKKAFVLNKTAYDEGSKAKFTIGDKVFDLQSYNLNYYPSNPDKTPMSSYQIKTFSVNLKTTKIDQELLNWLLDENQEPKTAEISVYDSETGKLQKFIKFTVVTTNSYSDNYNSSNYVTYNQYSNLSFRYKTMSIKLK